MRVHHSYKESSIADGFGRITPMQPMHFSRKGRSSAARGEYAVRSSGGSLEERHAQAKPPAPPLWFTRLRAKVGQAGQAFSLPDFFGAIPRDPVCAVKSPRNQDPSRENLISSDRPVEGWQKNRDGQSSVSHLREQAPARFSPGTMLKRRLTPRSGKAGFPIHARGVLSADGPLAPVL